MRYAPRVRVTVFIPTYNRAQLLRQTIESALGQSHADLGVVVSDNASTDETSAVVEGFGDPRIRYIRRSTNLGLVGNFNACLEEAKTEFTLILPDDDLLHRDYLADAVGLLENHPKAGMVHTAFDLIGPAGEVLSRGVDWTFGLSDDTVERGDEFIAESMRIGCRVCPCTALVRTAALEGLRFDLADFPGVDFGLWLRIALDWDVAFLARPLASCRLHAESETAVFVSRQDSGYALSRDWIENVYSVKSRFLNEAQHRLRDVPRLRKLARGARRGQFVLMARQATLPERRLAPTLRALAKATRADRGVLRELPAWRLLAASILGPRVVDRLTHAQTREVIR